jgi:lysophospholipase L1-like esterase
MFPCGVPAERRVQPLRVPLDNPPRARIFMLEVPPRGQDLKFRNDVRLEVNSAIREMPSIKPIDVDDAIACAWQTPCENYNADGLHFTPAGYKILTKLLREALAQ